MDELLEIEALTYGNAAVAHRSDGKAVFVEQAGPGDVVRVSYTKEKGSYCTARVDELVQAGPSRVEPACPYAHVCGGCCWQHVAYDAQLAAKRANLVDALRRIAHFDAAAADGLVEPCRASKRTMGYRNKLELACGIAADGRFGVGFHDAEARVLPVKSCPLACKNASKAPSALQGALRYLEGADPGSLGIYRIGVRASLRTNSLQVALWTPPGPFPRAAASKVLGQALRTTSIVRVLAKPTDARAVKGVEVLAGSPVWEENLAGFRFGASAPSFFQVNTAQAEVLVSLVVEGLDVKEGDYVADLYCGAGTFTLPLAATGACVFGVESAGSAVRDLRRNVEDAGVDVEVIGGDSARELPDLGKLDALVVDPPRAGLAKGVAESIVEAAPSRMAYVSCDPATWARDVERLEGCGMKLVRAVPVDLFPQTYHCEVVSFFEPR